MKDAGLSSTEKEFDMTSNDAEKITENILTRSSENSNSRKYATSEELEDGSDKEIDTDDVEVNKNLMSKDAENIKNLISRPIEEHDIGLLKFSGESGRAIVTDALRIEIINLGSKYFPNSESPFLPTNNRSMNKTWFKKKNRKWSW